MVDKIEKQRKLNEERLLKKKNVVGVGSGWKYISGKKTDIPCVRVYVSKKELPYKLGERDTIPKILGADEDVKTDVFYVGNICSPPTTKVSEANLLRTLRRKLSGIINRKSRYRPAFPGLSIGNIKITAGTFGAVGVWLGKKVIISNAHVLCEDPFCGVSEATCVTYEGAAVKKKLTIQQEVAIFQPGVYDGGRFPEDLLASMRKMVLIQENNNNYVDCSFAVPEEESDIISAIAELDITPTGIIPWNPRGTGLVGMSGIKSGRTTEVTSGELIDANATLQINYGDKTAKFVEQILFTDMSEGGDSGSLILQEGTNKAIGLLFAGSDVVTVANPIEHVLKPLGISLWTDQGEDPGDNKTVSVDFLLTKQENGAYKVTGTVTDVVTSRPIQNAHLTLNEVNEASVNQEGVFAFDNVVEGVHTIRCDAHGYLTQEKEVELRG